MALLKDTKLGWLLEGLNKSRTKTINTFFSPVAKLTTDRVFIAMATAKAWSLHQHDINNAFLHGYTDEEVYMVPPESYTKAKPGQVCKLQRSLYGLKQALRQWNLELTKFYNIKALRSQRMITLCFLETTRGC